MAAAGGGLPPPQGAPRCHARRAEARGAFILYYIIPYNVVLKYVILYYIGQPSHDLLRARCAPSRRSRYREPLDYCIDASVGDASVGDVV
jgi:hypothetical protein